MPPVVSVILPIWNEEAFIARTLGAVLAQDYPPDQMEILVADGMSQDNTRAIIAALPGAERVRIIDNPARLQTCGLNAAIRVAQGQFIIRVDGHTLIEPDYVRQCLAALDESGAWNVGGAMNPVGLTPMGEAIARAGKSAFAVPSAFHVSQQAAYTDTVYMGAWPRWVFERVGLFDELLPVNEDYEHNVRIRAAGGRVYFSPAIRSRYFGRQSLPALAKQYFRYGRYKVETLRRHPRSLRPRQLAAPILVAGLIAGPPLVLALPILRPLWLAGVAVYVALCLIFAARVGQARAALVFPTMHLSWGLGFWWGLLKLLVPR